MTTALAPAELIGVNDPFAFAFASFLRQNTEAWRIRRVDRFRPFDLHLAERQTTLQGRIDPELVARFVEFEDEPELLRVDPKHLRVGETLAIYIPVMWHPKRLHINHYARDRRGHPLPMVNRFQSARTTAVHLMAVLFGDEVNDEEARRLFVALMALSFQTPVGFEDRIRRDLHTAPPLDDNDKLLEWVNWEGDTFLPGLGRPLRAAVERYLDRKLPEFSLSDVPLLEKYTLERLFLQGIRDVLKTLAGLAPLPDPQHLPEPGQDQRHTRTALMDTQTPERLATLVETEALTGLELLSKTLSQAGEAKLRALYTELLTWTSYIPLEIKLGLPFTVELSETYPFRQARPRYPKQLATFALGSWQWYPVPLKDADGVHVEIEIPDAALHITKLRLVAEIPRLGTRKIPPNRIFGSYLTSSERMVHLYSSRMQAEAPQDDWVLPFVRAKLKVRLTGSVFFGHAFAAFAAAVAASYIAYATFSRAFHGGSIPPADLRVLATVGALSLTVGLWLTAIQHPRPITFKTLALARLILYAALITTLAGFVAYGIRRLIG